MGSVIKLRTKLVNTLAAYSLTLASPCLELQIYYYLCLEWLLSSVLITVLQSDLDYAVFQQLVGVQKKLCVRCNSDI